jgi:WD40 repeat protein/uncharacterized caspase-like protein
MKTKLLTLALSLAIIASSLSAEIALGVNSSHGAGVECIAMSADKAYIVSSANDWTVRIWHRESGRLVREFPFGESKYGEEINYLSVAADGRFIAAWSTNHWMRIWSVADGKLLFTTEKDPSGASPIPGGSAYGAAFSPSGRLVAIGVDGGLAVFDLSTRALVSEARDQKSSRRYERMSFYGEDCLAAFGGGKLFVFDLPAKSIKERSEWSGYRGEDLLFGRQAVYAITESAVLASDPRTEAGRKAVLEWKGVSGYKGYYSEERNELYYRDFNTLYKALPGGKEKILDFMKLSNQADMLAQKYFDADTGVYIVGLGTGALLVSQPWSGNALPTRSPVQRIRDIDVSNAGDKVLVGFAEGGGAVWDLSDIRGAVYKKTKGAINSVALSEDGSKAVIGGDGNLAFDPRTGNDILARDIVSFCLDFDPKTGTLAQGDWYGKLTTYDPVKLFGSFRYEVLAHQDREPVSGNPKKAGCCDLAYSPDGSLILTVGDDGRTRLWNASNGKELWSSGDVGKYTGGMYEAVFSRDGSLFASDGDYTPRVWETRTRKLLSSFKAKTETRSLVFSPSGKELYRGDAFGTIEIRSVSDGSLIKSFSAHSGKINGMGLAKAKGKDVLVSGGLDGALRLWSLDDYSLILTAYYFEGGEWAIVTPDGFWDASAKGGSLVNAIDGIRAYGIDQWAARSNRPDLIAERLGASADLVNLYRDQYEKRLRKLGLDEAKLAGDSSVPTASISASRRDGSFVELKLAFASAGKDLARYQVYANDVPLYGSAGKPLSGKEGEATERVELIAGENKIEVSCMDSGGAESYRVPVSFRLEASSSPDLYYLGFGVSKYADKKITSLSYAAKDAASLEAVFKSMEGRGFKNVHTRVLVDKEVDKANVAAAKDFAKGAGPQDVFVLFIAGHGIQLASASGGFEYYFVAADAALKDLAASSIPFAEIEDILMGIAPRQKLFLMDSCESGEADVEAGAKAVKLASGVKARIIAPASRRGLAVAPKAVGKALVERDRFIWNDLTRRSGAIVLSSCRADESSLESDKWKQGVFTSVILDAFAKKDADSDKNGILSVDELRLYVTRQVPEKIKMIDPKAQQHPVVDRDNIYADFGFPAAR